MGYRTAIFAAAACLLCASTPVVAQVTYQFSGQTYDGQVSATFTVPTFLTGSGTIAGSALSACTPFNNFGTATTCNGVSYNDNSAGQDQIAFNYDVPSTGGSGSFYYYFASGAFGADGTFYTDSNSGQNTGSLSVSGMPAAVPEPATWAMMLLGFGGIGFAIRRRRTPVLAQA